MVCVAWACVCAPLPWMEMRGIPTARAHTPSATVSQCGCASYTLPLTGARLHTYACPRMAVATHGAALRIRAALLHTHALLHMYVCIYIYVYMYIYISIAAATVALYIYVALLHT